jgi:NADPH2:quinone reductase
VGPEVLRIAEGDKPEITKDIDRVVTFDGVGEADRALEAGETLGRVVLKSEQE